MATIVIGRNASGSNVYDHWSELSPWWILLMWNSVHTKCTRHYLHLWITFHLVLNVYWSRTIATTRNLCNIVYVMCWDEKPPHKDFQCEGLKLKYQATERWLRIERERVLSTSSCKELFSVLTQNLRDSTWAMCEGSSMNYVGFSKTWCISLAIGKCTCVLRCTKLPMA